MVSSCCAPFCTNRATKATREKGIHFYRIPRKGEKRSLWLNAIKRKSFLPGPNTYICSVHFVGGKILIITVILLLNFSLGKKSSDPQSLSYSPSIFGSNISATQRAQIQQRYESV